MDNETFGQRLVRLRANAGLKQKELAEKAGISPTALNYYEKDKREPNVLIIKELALALGVSGDDLLGTSCAEQKNPPEKSEGKEKRELIDLISNLSEDRAHYYLRVAQALYEAEKANDE